MEAKDCAQQRAYERAPRPTRDNLEYNTSKFHQDIQRSSEVGEASMTAYATRAPLQLLTNTYYMMTEESISNRRSSARLKVKEDAFAVTGTEKNKQNGDSKPIKTSVKNGTTTRSKRKIGAFPWIPYIVLRDPAV